MKKLSLIFALVMSICAYAQSYQFYNRQVISNTNGQITTQERGNYKVVFTKNQLSVFKNGKKQYVANWISGNIYYHTSRNKYLEVFRDRGGVTIIDNAVRSTVYYY